MSLVPPGQSPPVSSSPGPCHHHRYPPPCPVAEKISSQITTSQRQLCITGEIVCLINQISHFYHTMHHS